MKIHRLKVPFIFVLLLVLNGCSSMSEVVKSTAGAAGLVGNLTSQLGVSNEQALGGTAALLGMAQNSLSADDFSSVTGALPGLGSLLGNTSSSGESTGSDAGLGGVESQFSMLGLSPDMVAQFIPILLQYAQSAGGENVMNILKGVFQ